ncbi:MAG: 7TM diverse intracellular signaling domain-containing protein, partial [Flavobacteriales bacterium]
MDIIHNNITVFILGCMFIFFIYHFFLSIKKRDTAILYYCFYIAGLIIYFSLKYNFKFKII